MGGQRYVHDMLHVAHKIKGRLASENQFFFQNDLASSGCTTAHFMRILSEYFQRYTELSFCLTEKKRQDVGHFLLWVGSHSETIYRRLPSNRPPLLKAIIWIKHGMGGYLIMQQMNRRRAHLT